MIDNEETQEEKKKEKFKWPPFDIKILKPVKMPERFWHFQEEDLYPISLCVFISFLIWVSCAIFVSLIAPLSYWDGPNYLYAAITLYNIPEKNPWTQYLSYPQSYFACHLPGYPLVIRLISLIFFNLIPIGYSASIVFIPCAFLFVFRRVLILYDCVKYPTLSATLSAILPLRFVIYHSTGASEPLFLLYTALGMIFFKTDNVFLLCLSICGCCITRVEGLIVWGTFGLCYLLRFDIKRAFCVGLCLLSFGFIILFHYFKFGEYDAYIKFNQGQQRIIASRIFDELRYSARWGWSPVQFESVLTLYIPFLTAILMCYTNHLPYAILGTAYFIFVSFLNHLDIYRYSIPGFLPTLIIGLDPFFSSKQFRTASPIILTFLIIFAVYHATNQIANNGAPEFFMTDVISERTRYI